MRFLHFLEGLRNPVCDFLFSLITHIGEETVFLAVAILFFWCINKREGYYILITGLIGTLVNQFLKMLCRIPRPWERGTGLTYVESAFEEAKGYSFPSGHTQNTAGTFGVIGAYSKKKWLRITTIVIIVLVGFSRMYLGVHTPADVLVSVVIACLLVFVAYPLFIKAEKSPRLMYTMLGSMLALVIAYVCFVCLYQFPAEVYLPENIHNLESAQKNGVTLLGCMVGFMIVYTVDLKYTKFSTDAIWWVQIIKCVGGLALVLAVKELTRSPLEAIFGNVLVARGVRYFLVTIVGGALWPLTFKLWARLGLKKEQN